MTPTRFLRPGAQSCALGALLLSLVLAPAAASSPENRGFLYGTITTVSGGEWTGYLRWGRQEAFWDDLFHSLKRELPYLEAVDEGALREQMGESDKKLEVLGLKIRISRDSTRAQRLFIARFGDIAGIEAHGAGQAAIHMRNGNRMEVAGYSDDVEGEIRLLDADGGEHEISWKNIDRIDFRAAPPELPAPARRLYGEVETSRARWTGFVMWDKEECLSSDLLDGESRDGDVSIEMGRIRSIERRGSSSSLLQLESGERMRLRGTNDVDDDNRGIMVEVADLGRITVDWEDFEAFRREDPPHSGRGYDDYGPTGPLRGQLELRSGETLSGRLVLDLDESENWEMLNGSAGGIHFDIPLAHVATLEPREGGGSRIRLRSGTELMLEEGQDVTDRNLGLLVYADDEEEPTYVPWPELRRVHFEP